MGREDLIFSDKFIDWEQQAYNVTIGDLLSQALPRIFEQENGKTVAKRKISVLSHGLKIELETPLYWLQLNMGYLDNFVYLSLHS